MKQSDKNTNYSGLQELLNVEIGLANYNLELVKMFHKELKVKKPCKILDFGAGIGTLSKLFFKEFQIKPICIEIDKTNIKYLKARKFELYERLDQIDYKFDYIFSSNVLEHIYDDFNIIKMLSDNLTKNGKIILFVPAFECLFSDLDVSVGHYRRYSKNDLMKKCLDSGLKILKCNYFDSIGFFVSYFMKFLKYDPKNGLGNVNSFKLYDKFILPVSLLTDKCGLNKIVGKNLVIICCKENE